MPLFTSSTLQISSVARAITVESAAPTMPRRGAPKRPKIRIALPMIFSTTANELIREAVAARSVVLRIVR